MHCTKRNASTKATCKVASNGTCIRIPQPGILMNPVVFEGCFGWLHPGSGQAGVVLCSPFGYDALCTHRGWRKLAERIAAAGLTVLRFDYPGTGDSAGSEQDPGRLETWLVSIGAAIRYLRETAGVSTVSLCGLRFGATLAALAAGRDGDIDALVMLAPALSGKNYLRELRAHRQSWLSTPAGINAVPIADTADYVEAFGFGIHGKDIADIASIDLRTDTHAPARRVLMYDASDRSRAAAITGQYAQQGVLVERRSFDEADRFLIEALYSEEPVEAFGFVTAWLTGHTAVESGCAGAKRQDAIDAIDASAGASEGAHEAPALRLEASHSIERPVRFGPYFGIHSQPDTVRADAPAVLFVNTGASHHIGDGRIFVLFARALAAQGIASLRMDLGGLGDSTPTAAEVTLDTIYSDASCVDAMAGADWLVAGGHRRIVMFGVCGGAFVGLHACARHPQIVGCYGVNLQKFIWRGTETTSPTAGLASTRVLRRSALSLEKWKRVLRGESSLWRVIRGLSQRAARGSYMRAFDLITRIPGVTFAPNEEYRLIQRLHAKGALVRLTYGEFDLGLEELKIQFGTGQRVLRRDSGVCARTLPYLDHALFTREAREAAMSDAQTWFFEHFIAQGAPAHRNDAAQASRARLWAADKVPPNSLEFLDESSSYARPD